MSNIAISMTPNSTPGGSPFDAIKRVREDGTEYWLARELAPLMGYPRWNEFQVPIGRAMKAAENQGHDVPNNFRGSTEVRKPGQRGPVGADFELSRFAAYLTAMNGDPNKPEVAAAQAYFAIQTHVAETQPVQPAELSEEELLARAVIVAQRSIASLEAKAQAQQEALEEAKPKVEYIDTFVSADSDLFTIRDLAGKLQVQESWLRDKLVEHKWIYSKAYSRFSNKVGKVISEKLWYACADKKHYFDPIFHYDKPRLAGQVRRTLKVKPEGALAISKAVKRWGAKSVDSGSTLPELEFFDAQDVG